ncbi:MAG: hypothetical protein AB1626_03430 [Candidatus Micrarchaeota archaeon]
MTADDLKRLVREIVEQAVELKNKHTAEKKARVNYACIFSQNQEEYEKLLESAHELGPVIKETPTGPLFHIKDMSTVAGNLRLLKIRAPDKTRPERGDADFTVSNYLPFKHANLSRPGFSLITRKEMEMIELVDPSFNVRAYFANPPLDKQLGL